MTRRKYSPYGGRWSITYLAVEFESACKKKKKLKGVYHVLDIQR